MTNNERPSASDIAAAEEQIREQSKRIDFYITEYSVEMLAQKMSENEYVVPDYQRNFTWEPHRKSRFVESLLMGLPIPFIFFWEMDDGRLEIVDGSQRLRTIEEFLYGGLKLEKLEQLTLLNGFTFSDLPKSRQRKLKNRSIRGIILNEHADEAARLDLFDRINTGSKIANRTEIRRGVLSGLFLDLVGELAEDQLLRELAPMAKKKRDERGYDELVTRLFAYGDGLDGYRDRPSDFLFNYSKLMNKRFEEEPELIDVYRQRFHRILQFVQTVFPYGFRRSISGKDTPKSRFEAIAIGVDQALEHEPSVANLGPQKFNVSAWLDGPEFKAITRSDGANARAKLQGRIDFVKGRLLDAAHE